MACICVKFHRETSSLYVCNKHESTYSVFFIVKGHKKEENVAVKRESNWEIVLKQMTCIRKKNK